jgi:hypothetical protein
MFSLTQLLIDFTLSQFNLNIKQELYSLLLAGHRKESALLSYTGDTIMMFRFVVLTSFTYSQ